MKTFTLFLFFLLWFEFGMSQDEEPKTLFQSNAQTHTGWFGSLEGRTHFFTGQNVETRASGLIGGQFGMIINRRFLISVGGYGKIRRVDYRASYPQYNRSGELVEEKHPMGLGYGYGGICVGYIWNSNEPIHLVFPVYLGMGTSNEYEIEIDGDHGTGINSPGFAIIEPGVQLELNLQQNLRLIVGINYRYMDLSRFEELNRNDLDGLGLHFGLKMGKF